jgi:hypothetical protein
MRIIFVKGTGALALLLVAMPLAASDIEYPPERIKSYPSYKRCLAALLEKHVEARATEHSSSVETADGLQTQSIHVTGIYYGGPRHASFSISHSSSLQPKPGGRDGHNFSSGIDWSCEGRVMFKGGGHSANARIPAAPLPPIPPPPPEAPKS